MTKRKWICYTALIFIFTNHGQTFKLETNRWHEIRFLLAWFVIHLCNAYYIALFTVTKMWLYIWTVFKIAWHDLCGWSVFLSIMLFWLTWRLQCDVMSSFNPALRLLKYVSLCQYLETSLTNQTELENKMMIFEMVVFCTDFCSCWGVTVVLLGLKECWPC